MSRLHCSALPLYGNGAPWHRVEIFPETIGQDGVKFIELMVGNTLVNHRAFQKFSGRPEVPGDAQRNRLLLVDLMDRGLITVKDGS